MTQSVLLSRRRALLIKTEVTEGTDPTPTGAANAVLAGNVRVTPLIAGNAERVAAFPTFGSIPTLPYNCNVQVEFDTEIAGSGAAGTAPAYGPLLIACGMAETVTASTRVEYAPISSSQGSVTIYANESGTLHKLTGARGTFSISFLKDQLALINWRFVGRYSAPTAVSLPSLTLTSWIDPIPVNVINTPTYTLDSYAAVLESLSMDFGNNIVFRDRPNASYVAITDRQGTGQVSFEAPALGTKDFFAIAKAGTQIAQQIIHGTVAGNIFQVDNPKAQLLNPAYGDVDGIKLFQAALRINRNAGDDEIKITVK